MTVVVQDPGRVTMERWAVDEVWKGPGEFPVAEDAGERALSLPFWPEITESEILRVVETLGEVTTECRDS